MISLHSNIGMVDVKVRRVLMPVEGNWTPEAAAHTVNTLLLSDGMLGWFEVPT